MELNELLNLPPFKAIRVERVGGEMHVFGEPVETEKTCPRCGKEEFKRHQTYQKKVRHLPVCNQPLYLHFPHILYRCLSCQKLYMERLPFADSHRHYTRPYEAYIYELCRGQSIERVAQLEGLSWDEAEGILKKGGLGPGAPVARKRRDPQPNLVPG